MKTHERAWRADAVSPRLPVCRPSLPTADELTPYLREIDETRWYSNGGPLVRRFEERLADHVQAMDAAMVATASSATTGLIAALLASGAPTGSLCMIPAWTFAASAQAAVSAGLVPWLVDVDVDTGALEPETASALLQDAPARVGAVLAVAPFGAPAPLVGWEQFQREQGIPVVLDAAASFDTATVSEVCTVVSLHATKLLGVGEGGFIMCTDRALLARARAATNFGFAGTRQALSFGLNAKMSEYSAAVGHAALDGWPVRRATLHALASSYLRAAPDAGIVLPPGFGDSWLSNTVIGRLEPTKLDRVEDGLTAAQVGSRRWWGDGLGAHPAFGTFPRTDLSATARLAACSLGLPFWCDLAVTDVETVCEVVQEVLRQETPSGIAPTSAGGAS